jgi:hypothetical protein
MKTITSIKAQEICGYWHDGGNSALYQFASSGIFVAANSLKYIHEIYSCTQTEYALYPYELKSYQKNQLKKLLSFFLKQCKQCHINIEMVKHPLYGYEYPVTSNSNIKPIYLFI